MPLACITQFVLASMLTNASENKPETIACGLKPPKGQKHNEMLTSFGKGAKSKKIYIRNEIRYHFVKIFLRKKTAGQIQKVSV